VFGINPSEFIVLVVVAAVVLGPERLPDYAAQLARLVRELRRMAQGASAQVRDELGPEFDDIDWRKLDPRQYDPRRIVREALADVWDPDDPLGLNEGNRPFRAEDDRLFDEADSDQPAQSVPKPQSAGGPADVAGSAPVIQTPVRYGDGPAEPEPAPPVTFDPDAT